MNGYESFYFRDNIDSMVSSEADSSRRWARLLLAAGIALRLGNYLVNRSLWQDEAMLACSFIHRDFAGLLQPLEYGQTAPPGFLYLERAMVLLFGGSEYALRFIPMLGAVAALLLFHKVAGYCLEKQAALIALGLVAFNPGEFRYAAELKPYSTDTAWTLLILLAVLAWRENWTARRLALLAALGAVALWFSNPAVFVLAGAGSWLVVAEWRDGRSRNAARLALVCAAWLASFAVQYFFIIRTYAFMAGMEKFWKDFFAPLPVTADGVAWYPRHFVRIFFNPGGFPFELVAAFIFLLGGFSLYLRSRRLLALLLLPLAFTLLASLLKRYPFGNRLLLFAVPLLLLMVAEGIAYVWSFARSGRLVAVALLLGFAGVPAANAVGELFRREGIQEVREAFHCALEHHAPDDTIYFHRSANAAGHYYLWLFKREELPVIFTFDPHLEEQSYEGQGLSGDRHFSATGRFWAVAAYPFHEGEVERALEYFKTIADPMESYKRHGAGAFLFQFRPTTRLKIVETK